jgi:hypothetical protein
VIEMSEIFYSYGESVFNEPNPEGEKRDQLKKKADEEAAKANQSVVTPVQAAPAHSKFRPKTSSGRSTRTTQYTTATENPHVASKRNERFEALVARRARQMRKR